MTSVPSLKQMCASRDLKVGSSVFEFLTPGIGHILANAGCDYAFLDMEHSGFSFDQVKAGVRYFEAANLPVFVRPPSKDYDYIARALDVGAEGLMLPMVRDAEEVRHILACMKYTPDGARGVALGVAHDNYRSGDVMDALAAANARSTMIALIETRAGIENIDEIAAVEGVDCLWVGHFDLSCDLGIPGQFDHPDFAAAIDAVLAAGKKHNKALGRLVGDVAGGIACHAQGFDFICYSGDVWALGEAVRAGVEGIRRGEG